MKHVETNRLTRMAIVLGVIALAGLFFAALALTDIAHGETDVSTEWTVVRTSFLLTLMYIGLSLVTLARLSRR